jgi:hypothetical protein
MIKKHPFNDGFPETLDFLDQYLATHAPVNTDIDIPVNTSVLKRICSKLFKFLSR